MKTLGPATKAAIKRLTDTLPYLRSEAAAIPLHARDHWSAIKAKYAQAHSPTGTTDPLSDAAQAHAEDELAKAIEQDEKDEAAKADETAFALPANDPEPAPAAPEVLPDPAPELPAESESNHGGEAA